MAEASIGFRRLVDNNPRPLDVPALERILDAAWHGDPARLSEEAVGV
jgi:alcohol dehydrogenase